MREHLLKRLAAVRAGGAAGASAMTLFDFALRLLKHRGEFRRELPPVRMAAAVVAAVRETYASGEGEFARIAGTPGFSAALAKTVADLEEGWVDGADLVDAAASAGRRGDARGAARWAEWARLVGAVERKVRAMGGETRRRVFRSAVTGFEHPGYPFRVTLYGFYDFTRLQWTLVDRLLSSGLLDEAYFPGLFDADGNLSPAFFYAARSWDRLRSAFEGNVEFLADDPSPGVSAVRGRIFSPLPPAERSPVPFSVMTAPHAEGEMRLAARRVRRWLDEAPGDSVFLVSRKVSPEAMAEWERVAAEYGIRTAGRIDIPLSSAPPVRLLLRMVETAGGDFPRRSVIDVLSSPYRRRTAEWGEVAARPDLWDILSRELLVVSGSDWETRLSRPRRRYREEEVEEADGRPAQLAMLSAEVRALRASLSPLREATGYAGLAKALRRILTREFRVVLDDTFEGRRDRRAVEALFSLIDDLEGIPDRETGWPGAAKALEWFVSIVSAQRLFVGETGGMRAPGTVVFGDAIAMRGVTGDFALVLSVNEDAVPAQLAEDPLLPDEEREELNRLLRRSDLPDALSLRRRNAAEEKLLFSLPAASVVVGIAFSVPRAEGAGGSKRPSRYLLHLLSRFAGTDVFSEEWEDASGAVAERMPWSPFAALGGDGPRSPREKALLAWREEGRVADPSVVPWERVSRVLSAWEARTSGASLFPGPGVAASLPASHSASALDELARCPYRYWLHRVLSFDPPEEPEETAALTPPEMGEIAHDILRRLGREAADGKGWGDVAAAARRAEALFLRGNPTGLPALFRIQCRAIARDVERVVAAERLRDAEAPGWRVSRVEASFAVPADPPLPAFRGRVDRLDRGPSGEARVVDYKYSDPKRGEAPADRMRHGLSHQLPVYLAYARTLATPPPAVSAVLYFLRNDFFAVGAPPWEEIRDGWAESLSEWLRLASAGAFPPLPHHAFPFAGRPAPRYCDACPFKDHCRVSPAYDGSECDPAAIAALAVREPVLRPVADHRAGRD